MPLNQEQVDELLRGISEQQQTIVTRLDGLDGISTRLDTIEAANSPEQFQERFRESFNLIIDEDDGAFVRKMRFGRADPQLVGTKYARYGMSVADVEFLYDVLVRAQRSGLSRYGPSDELRRTMRAVSQAFYLPQEEARLQDEKALDEYFRFSVRPSWLSPDDQMMWKRGAWQETEAYQRAYRAMDTAESGYGSQLVGVQYVGELWDAARFTSRIFALIDTFEMSAPTAYLPVEADLPEMFYVAENTSPTADDYATTKTGSNRVSASAKKMIIHQIWSGEMEEDSIIPFIPYLRRQAMLSLTHYADSLVLNGDTTNAGTGNINLDDADPADTKHYLAFDGVRHVGLVDNTNNQSDHSGAAPTFAAFIGQRKRMLDRTYLMDWGHPIRPEDLVYVVDPELADKICLLDEVITVDKFGQNATILTGQVARIGQHPLIASIASSLTEADGKVSTTAGNNTLGQSNAFNRRGFKIGWRRRVKLETERLPGRDQTRLIYSLRMGMGRYSATGAAAAIECADTVFNIAV